MSSKQQGENKQQESDQVKAVGNTARLNNEATTRATEPSDVTVAAVVNNKNEETTNKAAVVDDKNVLLNGEDSKNSK